jgi:glycosyltransferase involved in cell wall biosynthesis
MHILMLTGQMPYPPHAGGAMRVFGLLNGLRKAGHTLDLITFVEPGTADPATTPLHELCRTIVTVPLPSRSLRDRLHDLTMTGTPDLIGRFHSVAFEAQIIRLCTQNAYDLVQMESLETTGYHATIRTARPGIKLIYDSFNAEYELQHRIFEIDRGTPTRWPGAIYSLMQWRRLMRYERSVCQAVDRVIAVSEADSKAFGDLVPGLEAPVVPNGIAVEDYAPDCVSTLDLGDAALLFTGTMNYRPNVDAVTWFAESIFPTIREAVPHARLFIVGNKPGSRVDALRDKPGIEVTGYVQDMQPFLCAAAVYVAPLRMGSGTRLKLLQAMAARACIIATHVGAEGLVANSGQEMILADDAESFARAVISLLQDSTRRVSMGAAAHKLVCDHYDWSVIVPRLLAVYREMGLPE